MSTYRFTDEDGEVLTARFYQDGNGIVLKSDRYILMYEQDIKALRDYLSDVLKRIDSDGV